MINLLGVPFRLIFGISLYSTLTSLDNAVDSFYVVTSKAFKSIDIKFPTWIGA